jgi:fermentation-respiration switch protein FrsA (DUF1100 family)
MLYHPSSLSYVDIESLKPRPEEIWIPVGENEKLHAWYFKAKIASAKKLSIPSRSKGLVLHFHGNAENLSTHFRQMRWIVDEGYDYLIFDYRGYGKSPGVPLPCGTVEDGLAMINYVEKRWPKVPHILIGQSLGGIIALRTAIEAKARKFSIHALVIEGSFSSYEDAGAFVLSKSWLTWLFQPMAYLVLSDQCAPKGRIKELAPIPLLVIHGTDDSTIGLKLGEDVFNEALPPKDFWRVEGAQHLAFFGEEDSEYRKKLIDYLEKLK